MRTDVPKELRAIIGQTSLKKTLGTFDLELAKIAFHGVMQGFEATIVKARKQVKGEAPSDLVLSLNVGAEMAASVLSWEASTR